MHANIWREEPKAQIVAAAESSLRQSNFLDSATKFGQIETFAVPDPDVAGSSDKYEQEASAEVSNLLKSSYIIHTYGVMTAAAIINPDNVSPLRRSSTESP